ncbi:uncharacterized protein LOC127712592 isoform X2 [Mytilus californianus]|uniref:uncharacterized protein LOC127712592 isoform X2 n=1 Tax=Mytilus californianus TaxID=6549 RepID=UPI0022463F71|nr:uncharacterized protein LOC127712592 isoform X2 [Mytilus californianus]
MELISLVKKKKSKEAIDLIKAGSNLDYVDENGCTCLHYASSGGLLEFIVAAAQHGIDIEQRDKDGETALFKAVKNSNVESMVALVAFRSTINVKNNKGQSPLDIAVAKKDAAVIELLCSFGSSVTIDDWALVGVDVDILNKADQKIMRTLINQLEREAENNYGNNAFEVCYVNPAEDISICTDIILNTDNISNGFFLYCSKVIPEYNDFAMHLGFEDQIFSDVYEIKTWGDTPRYLDLHISVLGFVQENQLVVVMPLEGSVEGNITGQAFTEGDYEEEYTKFDIKIDLTRMKTAKFVVLSQRRHEEFAVTQDALKIVPQSESNAEIDIPEGAFKSPGKLMLNVADTNDWNGEETVLFTNALDLTMQNNVQPSKPVNMKLPLHSLVVSADDFIIIASHTDIPEAEKDWEICSTNIKIEGNIVSFSAEHFTHFAVGSKKNFKKSAESATLAVNYYRPTEIFAGFKKETDNKLTLIVEIALKHYGKRRRKYWRHNGFRLQTIEYRDGIVQDGEKLKISLEGNFQIDTISSSKEHIVFNHYKKRNYRTFYIVSDQHEPPIGDVIIFRTKKKIVEQSVVETLENKHRLCNSLHLCNNVVKVATSRKVAIENGIEELVRLPIDGQLFDDNQDVGLDIDDAQYDNQDVGVDKDDAQCTIPVLRKSSLFRLGKQLSEDECYKLGVQLNISEKKLSSIETKLEFKTAMFEIWRPSRPNETLVFNLVKALNKIEKGNEADAVQEAFANNVEFKLYY